jgi:pentatricopeptide repeat protein
MNIQSIDNTNVSTLLPLAPKKRARYQRKRAREFSWTPEPEVKATERARAISSTITVFTISELVCKIFCNPTLSITDIGNFEAVCKSHRYVTYSLWNLLREQKGFTYNWNLCKPLEFKEKTSYILSNFLFQYASGLHKKKPVKELSQRMASISRPFPIFKTFCDALLIAKNGLKSLGKVDDELKGEPILHATIKIYQCAHVKMRPIQSKTSFMPEEVLESAKHAISAGATCLAKLAVILCKNHQKRKYVLRNRYALLLRILAELANKKGDPSGKQSLIDYAKAKDLDTAFVAPDPHFHRLSFPALLEKQLFVELSGDEILFENELFRKLDQQLKGAPKEDAFPPHHNTIMEACVNLERYEQAESIWDRMPKKEARRNTYLAAIRMKMHFEKFDEVNALYDAVAKNKFKLNDDLSFLIDFARFKLEYEHADLEKTDAYLMKYWKNPTWHHNFIFNYASCLQVINTAEDFQAEPLQRLLELTIEIKSKINLDSEASWFKNVLEAIMLDTTDKASCLEQHKSWISQKFYYHSQNDTLPALLQEKITRVREQGCCLAIESDAKNPVYADTFTQVLQKLSKT